MKRILLLSLLLLPIVALAQYPTFSNKQRLGVQTTGDGLIFRGTTINNIPNYTPSNVNNAYFHLDTVHNKLYLYNANAWQLVYPSPQFDTTTLNVYLKISDTTAMLLPYFRDSDTTSLNLINRFALKLNISDTATMLTPYMKKADTISLSNRINLKFNISDTIILSNRITTNANNIITINNKLATKLDTIYVKFKNVVTRLLNKDTINIGSSLTDGYAINIIGDSVNIDTVILDTRYPDRDSTNELQDITFATTSGIVTISGGKVMNLDTLYSSVIDSVNLLIKDSIAAFTPLTEGYGINIIGDSINVDTTVIFTQSDTITLSNRINTKLNASDTASLSNRINNKLDTIYVNYQTNVDVVTNKDTINIIPLTEGFGINIIADSINIDSAVILETQQKQIAYVKNMSGVTIYKGQAVYSSGSSGGNKLVTLASSNTEQASSKTFGIVETDSIPNGGHGYVITFGVLSGFNTNALTEGLTVYLSSTPGQLTSVKPIAPLNLVTIGICIRQQQNNGSIFVKIQNGFEFDELHDVRITTPVDKSSIYYNLSENLWRDTTATLLVSDTASMLNPYLRKLDTITLSNRIDLRVKYADTTNMLLPYFRTNDTTLLNLNSRLSIKLNLSDTANMLSKYVNTYSNQIDINGNKTFNNVVTIDSATVTGKLLVNTNISDAVKINSNTNSTNLELMNSGGSVFIKSGNKNMTLQTDTTALVYLKGDVNKVGILTMNPQQALQVSGTIRVDSLSNNLTPVKIIGANNSNDLTNLEIGNGLFISNDTLRVADNVINSGDTATLLRQDFLGINTNVLTWKQGSKKLLPYFTQVYRNGQLLKSESQYTITNDSIVTLATGSFKLDDNITIIAIDNIIALAGGGGIITLQGDISGSGTNTITTTIGTGKVLNSMLAGSITNDKLDVITATNKVSNSATTATNLNTNNAIVSRDGSGNFSAGTITASLNGNANTSTTLATGRTIGITGDLTYTSPSFNGSTNITAVGTLANSGVVANTYTAATITVDAKGRITSASANTIPTVNDGILTMSVSGNGLTGSQTFTANQSTAATFTVNSNATNTNTPSTIVYRDASGNFSAGNITANTFIGNATSSTTSTSTVNVLNYLNSNELFKFRSTNAINVSGQILVTTPGTDFSIARNDAAQTFTGTQTFSNTIIGNISGNAATVTTNANLTGDVTSTGNATSIATGVIVNDDINTSAAIAVSKLAASTISGVTLGNNLNTLTISSPLTGTSYNGSSAVSIGIQAATTSVAGSMSAADKTKLDGIAAGAQVNVPTNLAQGTRTTTTVPITSSTGTTATLDIATTSLAGVMSSEDKAKLDGIASGATANTGTVTSVAALTLTTTGTDVSSSVATGTTTPVITLNIPSASSTNRGVLTSTDWTTFNAKQAALGNASSTVSGILTSNDWNTFNNKQNQLTGTGFVKASGISITYDNSTYLTTGTAASTYLPLTGGTLTGALSGTSLNLNAGIDASGNFSTSYHTNVSALFRGYQVLVAPNIDYGSTRIHFPNRPVSESFSDFGSGIRHKWAGSDARNSFLSLYTSNNLNLQIDAVSIDALGNVGIRDTTPSYTLDINGTLGVTGATTLGSTLAVTGATNISNTLSTTNYVALDAGVNTHRFTNTLSGNQTWTPSAGFITSYFNNNASGGWYYNTAVDNSGFPILSILSTSNDRKKSGITLNSQGTANGTYSPAITFSSLSNSTNYYSAYAAIIGKKTGVGGASGSDANWNTGHIEFYGTTQATDVNGGVMLNSPSMTLGLGVGIGYDAPPTVRGRLLVSERIGVATNDPTNTVDINGTLRVRTTNTITSTALLGRDNNGIVGGIIVGNGLTLSNSTLSLVSSGGFITTNSNYTVTITDTWIVFNNNFSNITVTLPDASTSTGRTLYFRNTAAGSIVSAGTANIIDNTITTGTPNNNILGAGNTNVKWCTLVSNGQYWIKMQAGSL